jgi:hypothetical protein
MSNALALELASLASRHPELALLSHAIMAVIRLKLDPTPSIALAGDLVGRKITVSHRPKGAVGDTLHEREIGWAGVGFTESLGIRITNTYNDQAITENAAIAVMALLAHEIEGIVLKRVLPIGSGGDYAAIYSGHPIQVEVSGIKQGHPSDSHSRLREKREQVLKQSPIGIASVTTFYQICSGGGVVHSFLHYVESNNTVKASRKGRSRRKP